MSITGNAFDSALLRRIFRFTQPYRKLFWTGLFLTLLLAVLSPVRPMLTQYILDHFLAQNNTRGLLLATIGMVGILLMQSLVQYFHTWSTNELGQKVIRDLRNTLFERMLSFRLRFFDRTPIGTTVTRSVSDMETIADIFSEGLIVIIGDLLQLIVIITVMFVLDWRLALISLSTIPLLIIATNIFKNKIKETFGDVRNQVSALNTFTQEHLTGMKIVQLFGREKKEYNRFEAINARHRDANIKSVWYYSIFFPVVEILSAISIGLIVWWGAGGVIRDDVTFGNLVAFIMYINMLFRPIRELADKFNTLQMGMVSSERIFKIMDEDEVTSDDGNLAPSSLKGDIEFKDVWFTYDKEESEKETTNWILKGISFKVKAGETIAFVGATGAGKSTIIGLLNRFYETNRGEILIDGVNIRSYRLTWLRQHIGIVLQDVFLFSDSIRNNLTLQNSAISDTELMAGAEVLGASALIKNLPGGLDFNVQERGNALSTGQRQLISFIRAYCYNPSVLVLDEATSSVDSETEELITAATRKLTQKSTSIVIAHRLATIQNADRIIVLEKGQIIETGNHTELIQQDGHYRHLFEIQFNGTGTEKINITN